jgi:hypothetical protein
MRKSRVLNQPPVQTGVALWSQQFLGYGAQLLENPLADGHDQALVPAAKMSCSNLSVKDFASAGRHSDERSRLAAPIFL